MRHAYSLWLTRPLAALGLLLATAGAAQAQTPASFAPVVTYPTGGSLSLRVVAGDLNGDGRPDAVTANITSNDVSVFLNSGTGGTFGAATRYLVAPAGTQVQGLTLADVNADGRLDIVTANNGNSTVSVLLGQAGGIFGAYTSYPTGTNTAPRNAAVGDVNGDGLVDIVTGNSGTANASVLLGLGGGGFGAPALYATAGLNFDVALGDVTGDGRLDIVTPSYSTNSVSVLPGQAGGTFGAFTSYSTGTNTQTVGIRLGDVNSDGLLDIVATNQNSTLSVLLGQAGGTLAPIATYSTGAITNAYAVSIGDVNGDGRPDLVPGNFTGSLIGVLLGQASGFGAITTFTGGNGPQGITLADVNTDGKLDILTANRNNNTLGVLLNTTVFAPTLTSISPNPAAVGTSVTLTGTGLGGATAISFNGTAATPFAVVNATTITATVPTGATSGLVTVTTPSGTSGGVAFTVLASAPVLANIETSVLPSVQGQTPPQVTSTLTVSDADSPNLTGATVAISSGFVLNDVLVLPNQTTITGTYFSGTGVLVLSGTASVAAYQAALRSIVFAAFASASSVAGSRVISFSVSDGTNTSNQVARTVRVTAVPTVATAAPGSITTTSAILGGAVTNNGGDSNGNTGIVYVQGTGTPTLANTLPSPFSFGGVSIGSFNGFVGGLTPGTTYTVRAFATNSAGTSYGSPLSFTTLVPVTAAPVLTAPATNATTNGLPTYAGTAPAGSTVTVYLAMGSGTAQAIGTTTATGGNFSLAQPTALASGTYSVYATALASGASVSANSNTNTFTVDATPPTATLTATASTTTTGYFLITVTFSEPVTGFSVSGSGVTVTNGAVVASSGPVGNAYTFNVRATNLGPVTVSIAAGVAQDAAGNDNVAAGPLTVTYSLPMSVAPVLLNPTNGTTTRSPIIIGGSAPTGSFVGITVTNLSNGGTSYRSTSATNNNFSSQFNLPSGTYQAVATAQQSGSQPADSAPITFTIDATPPTATISSTAGTSTSTTPIPFTITFSEPIQGLTASSLQVSNGTITSAITNVGNDYSFSVTPTASGIVTVTLPTNAVRDQYFNTNAVASSLSVTYTAPITATTWTGTVSTDWFDTRNWTQGVPTATVDATIAYVGSGRYPLIAASPAAARNLTINSGASLTMSGGTLDVRANWTNNSAFVATGGTVVLGTSTLGNLLGSGTTNFWSLQVEASGSLLATSAGATVQQVLTLNGGFAANGNPFTLRSNATGTALVVNNGGVVSGTATVQRYIDPSVNPGLGYRHYSAPVSNSTVGDLSTLPTGGSFVPVVNPAYNTAAIPGSVLPYPTVFGYNERRLDITATSNNLGFFDKGYFSPDALSDPLAVGRGYTVNIGASELVDFQGALNNGNLTQSLTSTRNNYPDGGWHLLGNPYPAPLDYSRVAAADRLGLESAIYVYSSTSQYSGRYRAYINGIGNPVLPVGQGFFARVAAGQSSAVLTFRNSQRLTAPNGTAFQRPAADPRPLVQLELRTAASPAAADEFFAYAEAGATPTFDPQLDAQKLPNPTGFNLASLATSGQPLAVDGRAAFTAATVLPLTVGVPAAGTYALSAATLANLPTGLDAYLADDLTGQLIRLAAGTSYSFSVSAAQAAATITGRFRLMFRPATALATTASLSAADISVFPNPAHARFTVLLPGLGQATSVQAELLNALGQVVRRQQAALPATGTQLSFDTAELATGVYVLRLQAGSASLAKRVVIE